MTDRWLKVNLADEAYVCVDLADAPRLDAAVTQYLDSGKTRDCLLHLSCIDGDAFTVRVSLVNGWTESTPEGRRAAWEFEAALREETRLLKAELGIFEE